jgi:hypothetical protein
VGAHVHRRGDTEGVAAEPRDSPGTVGRNAGSTTADVLL